MRLRLQAVIVALSSVTHHLFFLLLAAGTVALAVRATGVGAARGPAFWVAVAPLIYMAWLLILMLLYAAEVQVYARLWPKPRRASSDEGARATLQLFRAGRLYSRALLLQSLPLARLASRIPGLRLLVFLTYAPSAHVGAGSQIWGSLLDPDLTFVGEGAVIGGEATVVAHAMNPRQDGHVTYVSAPVVIGEGVSIGGRAHVAMGVEIADGAVVEPFSDVRPFTRIPAGEVWGGHPAIFRRHRDEPSDARSARPGAAAPTDGTAGAHPHPWEAGGTIDAAARQTAREIVANALDLEPAEVTDDLRRGRCARWDSMGQMALAAALHQYSGIDLSPEAIFALESVEDVARLLVVPEPAVPPASAAQTEAGAAQANAGAAPTDADAAQANAGAAPTDADAAQANAGATQAAGNLSRGAVDTGPLRARAEEGLVEAGFVVEPGEGSDWLPLLETEEATRLIARRLQRRGAGERLHVVVAATFNAGPLQASLRLWSRAFGVEPEIAFAPFGQVFQALAAEGGAFRSHGDAVHVMLVRPEDLGPPGEREKSADDLLAAAEAFAAEGSSLVASTLPAPARAEGPTERAATEELRARWRRRLTGMQGVEILDLAELVERVGWESGGDVLLERAARAPFSQRLFQEVGRELARIVRRRCRAFSPAKVLALDCDGVLWGGVLAEDGAEGIVIGPDGAGRSFRAVQETAARLQGEGVLIALVSRNREEDVFEVFRNHPEMVLRPEQVACARIGWGRKSDALREVAAELNVGLDSLVFVDDDPVQRLEVRAHVPEVRVVPLPAQAERFAGSLERLWLFDGSGSTPEDGLRTEHVRAEKERARQASATGDMGDYLRDLDLQADIHPCRAQEKARLEQLTRKTNQFNVSLNRLTGAEVQALAAEDAWVVRARDRFGDYGLIGAAILGGRDGDVQEVQDFLLSCRALGRGLEDALLARVADEARRRGAAALRVFPVEGPRNRPVHDFLEARGFRAATGRGWEVALESVGPVPAHIGLAVSARRASDPWPAPSPPAAPSPG